MMVLNLIVVVLGLSFLGLLSASFVQMIRAQSDQEHQQAERTLTAALIAGVIIAVAPSLAQWITGYNYNGIYYCPKDASTPDEGCLPEEVSDTLHKIVNGVMALGGVVIVFGLVWGGIQMRCRRREPDSSGPPEPTEAAGPLLQLPLSAARL